MVNDNYRPLDEQLAALGLPDDLPEVALRDAPAPDAAALARIKSLTFSKAGVAPVAAVVQRRSNRLLRWALVAAAMVVLAVVGIVVAIGPQRVWAAFQRFVPGFGLTEDPGVRFAASQPVRMERDGAWVEVQGLVVADGSVTARLRSHRVLLAKTGSDGESLVSLVTAQGNTLKQWSWTVGSGDPDDSDGQFEFLGSIPTESRKVVLVVKGAPEWRLEIPLVPADQLLSTEAFGPSATVGGPTPFARTTPSVKGADGTVVEQSNSGGKADPLGGERTAPANTLSSYTLSARVTPSAMGTALTVIAQSSGGGVVEGFLGEGEEPEITLSAGNWKTIPMASDGIKSGEQIWDFTAETLPAGTTSVTVRIPRLRVVEPGEATVQLKVANAALNETIQLGRWPVRLVRTEEANGRLTVFGDAGPGQTIQDANGLHTDYLSASGNVEVRGGNGGMSFRGRQDPLYTGPKRPDAQLMDFRFPIPESSKIPSNTVTITIRNPKVLVQGPWIITVPIEGKQ